MSACLSDTDKATANMMPYVRRILGSLIISSIPIRASYKGELPLSPFVILSWSGSTQAIIAVAVRDMPMHTI
jgi:hypothetical protein